MIAKKENLVKGYTLVEVLVALGILSVVMAITVNSFMNVLRRSAKAKAIEEVQAEGNYALRMMERLIRNATNVIAQDDGMICESGMERIRIRNLPNSDWGDWVEFGCMDGYLEMVTPASTQRLTSINVLLGPVCQFNCEAPDGLDLPKKVSLFFSLSKGDTNFREEWAEMNFQTSISLRNF